MTGELIDETRSAVLRKTADAWLDIIADALDQPEASMFAGAQHLQRRAGQMLRTDDGRWLLVRRDVPVAAAETYPHSLQSSTDESGRSGGDPTGRPSTAPEAGRPDAPAALLRPIGQGASWAREDPEAAGTQIQNMLDHYTALHTQEPPSTYPCAALLVGMAMTLLADSGSPGVESYLGHLSVMDHAEALCYGRRRASLTL